MPTILMHDVDDISLETFSPDNSNFVRVSIVSKDETVALELFSLPEELAIRLCRAFGNAGTTVHTGNRRETLVDYLTFYDVTQKMEDGK